MKLDQHFVIDEDVLLRVAELAEIQKKDILLEIGAGTGNLTKLLLKKAKFVHAVEKDEDLLPELEKLSCPNIRITIANALKIKFPKFDKLVANLPYSISEPLMQKLVYEDFKLAVLLLPEKFVKTIFGDKTTKLTLIVKAFFEITPDKKINPESFSPQPKVYSRIIILKPKTPANMEEAIFMDFLKQRDKKAGNALREAVIKGGDKFGKEITKKEAKEYLKDFKIEKKVAMLSMEEVIQAKNFISKIF